MYLLNSTPIVLDDYGMHLYFFPLSVALFALMMVTQGAAYYYACRKPEKSKFYSGGTIEAAIFALLGLLIAFTYASARERFDERRRLITKEVNALQTTLLRFDLLPTQEKEELEQKLADYIDSRARFSQITDLKEGIKELEVTKSLQKEIWKLAVNATEKETKSSKQMLFLSSLNELFDIETMRLMTIVSHTPIWIFLMFCYIVFICSILAGFRMAKVGKFSWSYSVIFALATTVTMYMILDMEYPRFGLIRLTNAEKQIHELEKQINQPSK